MKLPSREEVRLELNMTPMIDVVFQLLIFFMCGTKFRALEGRVDANLPKTDGPSGGAASQDFKQIVIRIAEGGRMTFNQIPCDTYQALLEKLTKAKDLTASPRIVIDPARLAKHEHVLGVMDQCLKAGLHEISFRQPLPPD